MNDFQQLAARLTGQTREIFSALTQKQLEELEELRFYLGQNAELVIAGRRVETDVYMGKADMDGLLSALSGFALYRFETQMALGYIPLEGGHRAGICGSLVRQADGDWRMSGVTSVCLRLARHVEGASAQIRTSLFAPDGRVRRVLLFGPPGCGKTTVLRDAALFLCEYVHVAAADEREELFPQGVCLLKGKRLDVLRGADKARAFSMLIRSMAPQAIVCDELGREEDVQAVLDAARCGAGLLATAHADGLEDLRARPTLGRLFNAGVFERYIHLGRRAGVRAVYDGAGRRLEGEGDAHGSELERSDGGDDRRERRRLSFVGR